MTAVLVSARFPLHELEALLGWPLAHELADMTGVSKHVVGAWKRRGLSWEQASDLADRFGYFPTEIWGRDWWEPVVPKGHPRSGKPPRVKPKHGAIGSLAEQMDRVGARGRQRHLHGPR